MSRLMRWIYRDMLDVYYDTEKPLSNDIEVICDLLGVENDEEISIVKRLLRFKFTLTEDGYRHDRCDEEISEYQTIVAKNQVNGKKGGRPKGSKSSKNNPVGFQSVTSGMPVASQPDASRNPNHEPITSKPISKQSSSSLQPFPFCNEENDDDEFRGQAPMPDPEEPAPDVSPEATFAVALRKQGVKVTYLNVTLHEWVKRGVTMKQANDAIQKARVYKPHPELIEMNYLNTILVESLKPKTGKPIALPEPQKWYESASGIVAKGKELGLTQNDKEPFPAFKDRVAKAAKLSRTV